jgi:hypothetical protein
MMKTATARVHELQSQPPMQTTLRCRFQFLRERANRVRCTRLPRAEMAQARLIRCRAARQY